MERRSASLVARVRTLASASLLSGVLLCGGALVTLIAEIQAARLFGTAGYGLYRTTMSIGLLAAALAGLGLPALGLRVLPAYAVRGELAAWRSFRRRSQGLTVLAGLTAGVPVGVVLARLGMSGWTLILAAILPATLAILTLESERARASGLVLRSQLIPRLGRPALLLLALLALATSGRSQASHLVAAATAAALLAAGLQVLWSSRGESAGPTDDPATLHPAAMLRTGAPLLVVAVSHALLFGYDVVILAVAVPPTELGVYAGAARVALVLSLPQTAVNTLAGPQVSKAAARGEWTEASRIVKWAGLLAGTSTAVASAAIVWRGPEVLRLLGADFRGGLPVLCWLAAGYTVAAATGSVGPAAQVLGLERAATITYLAAAGLGASGVYFAGRVPSIAVAGAVVAIVMAAANLALWTIVRRHLTDRSRQAG